jgi:hypothetical protein
MIITQSCKRIIFKSKYPQQTKKILETKIQNRTRVCFHRHATAHARENKANDRLARVSRFSSVPRETLFHFDAEKETTKEEEKARKRAGDARSRFGRVFERTNVSRVYDAGGER